MLAVIETKAYGKKIAVTSLNTGRAAFISIIQACNSFKFPIEIKCNMPSINNHKNQQIGQTRTVFKSSHMCAQKIYFPMTQPYELNCIIAPCIFYYE